MSQLDPAASALHPFDFAGRQVRVVTDEHGDPWFVARDVCAVLDITNGRDAIARLADDEKGVATADTPGGAQQVGTVSEAGLYRLIFTSRKAEAETFRRWVTHEVLPAIRRTGSYAVPAAPAAPAIPQTYAEALRAAADQSDRADAAEARVLELEPKADLADTFLIADGSTRLVREVAKLLAVKESWLRRFLIEEHLIFPRHAPCGNVSYDHYAAHAHHFVAKEVPVQHTWGTCTHYTLRVTARGVELIRKRIRDAAEQAPLAVAVAAGQPTTGADVAVAS